MKIVLDTNVLVSGLLQPFGTGNIKHYPAKARGGVEVLSPNLFLESYRERL